MLTLMWGSDLNNPNFVLLSVIEHAPVQVFCTKVGLSGSAKLAGLRQTV